MAQGKIQVNVRSNMSEVLAKAKEFPEKLVKTATFRALNRALDKSATETSREIRKQYNVRDRAIKAAMKKHKANRNNLIATLALQGAGIPLIEFDARWRRGMPIGATVRIKRGGGRVPVGGAFIAMGKYGTLQVFRRRTAKRGPLKALRSVSIPQQFQNKEVLGPVQHATHQTFIANLEQQIKFLTAGK